MEPIGIGPGGSAGKRKAASPSPERGGSMTASRSVETAGNNRKRRVASGDGKSLATYYSGTNSTN